jgi:hypothetical protein
MTYVQFTDNTDTVICSVFASPQDPNAWANLGEVEDNDPRLVLFLNPGASPEAILKAKQDQKDALLAAASQSMAPILVSLQLGDATDAETVTAKAWQAYYRALKSVDVTVESPAWPVAPV